MHQDKVMLALRRQVSVSPDSFENELHEELTLAREYYFQQNKQNEEFHYFWNSISCFSQWHMASFKGPGIIWDDQGFLQGLPKEILFSSVEQFMMYHKAMLFLDRASARVILKTDSPREQKKLGRQVSNFDEQTWLFYRAAIVYWGNEYKFSQNAKLLNSLHATSGKTLVEASPYDSIWGVGMAESNTDINNRKMWKGKNLLGEILTGLRTRLNNGVY